MHRITPRQAALMAIVGTLAACSSGGSGPSTGSQVTFSVGTKGGNAAGLSRLAFLSDTQNAGTDVLILDTVKLVLRDVRFKRVEDSGCPDDDSTAHLSGGGNWGQNGDDGHADACESFNAGPYLLDLPLGPGVDRAFSIAVDTGTYDQLRVKIHRPSTDSGDAKDVAFLAAHPEYNGVSIRAVGSFDGTPFVYTTGLSAEERVALIPPIAVADSTTNVSVTIKVDVSGWFSDGSGNLVDPSTADSGGVNLDLVRSNIRRSFHAFRDENHDCHNDHGSDNN